MSFLQQLFSLNGKHAVVTGAASGLGQQCAVTLTKAGARVSLIDIHTAGLAETAKAIQRAGGTALELEVDVAQSVSVAQGLAQAVKAFGPIHILVNSAGIFIVKSVLDVTEQEWDRLVAVNLKGIWLMSQAVAKHMVEQRISGSIINISSADSHRAQKGLAPYAATKAAVNHLTRNMSYELAKSGVRVNTLAPGGMLTNMVKDFLKTPDGQAAVWTVPFKRFAEMHELDGPLLLLASEASSYMTGSVLTVDGGLSCNALQYRDE
ncbi:MAG TPA: SDR family oxidoreductase [Nitrospiraceae bacterium]|nr:SDR family oxidoreductase [Nitrospiraceae bacterium]